MCITNFDSSKIRKKMWRKRRCEAAINNKIKRHDERAWVTSDLSNSRNKRQAIIRALIDRSDKYYRLHFKLDESVPVLTYTTDEDKVACLCLDTPKKRLYFRDNGLLATRTKYGWIPKPVNVLKREIDKGIIKSEDVEHVYHLTKIDVEITGDKQKMSDAYDVSFSEADKVVPYMNGYSCMSKCPGVGLFYYYFGAKMLIAYDKDKQIVGRAVLWPFEDKLYLYKAYALTGAQRPLDSVIQKMINNKTLVKEELPDNAFFKLRDPENPALDSQYVYDAHSDEIIVPYIDENLGLDEDKQALAYNYDIECKTTEKETLCDYEEECWYCERCGCRIHAEDDVRWVDGGCYCDDCVIYCDYCEEYHVCDEDYIVLPNGDTVVGDCTENFVQCTKCGDWINKDYAYYGEPGDDDEDDPYCEQCFYDYHRCCEDCGSTHLEDNMIHYRENDEDIWLCNDCLKNKQKDEQNEEQTD